jgi:hypothetical protein
MRCFPSAIFFIVCILAQTGFGLAAQELETTRDLIDFQRPDDAVQLIGNDASLVVPETNTASQWVFEDGIMTASPKWDSVVTPNAYRDFRLHVEYRTNDPGEVKRGTSGNSGIYLQQRYEIQILNSHGIEMDDFKFDDCGCIYGVKKPDVLVCKPAEEWQHFDIAFRAARFKGSKKVANARITVYHNGALIHDDFAIPRKTGAGKREQNTRRPILLQGHHNQVQYRNVWIQELKLGGQDNEETLPNITASNKQLPTRGETFKFNGNDAFIIYPKGKRDTETPWVWYAPTLKPYPAQSEMWMFERFLNAGVAIAGIDVGESYGSPQGCAVYSDFYKHLVTNEGFNSKPCLLARSRGGLMHYSWAADHVDSISGIAGIYPVTNVASYPGIERACGAYQMNADELKADLETYNPVDRLSGLAKANVPIHHIHGALDDLVPLDVNSAMVAERYKALGGTKMTLEVIDDQGHNMWPGFFESEKLVRFVLQCVGRPDTHPLPFNESWLRFAGKEGPGKGKHVVLIAAEQEYRSEQSMPMLAKVLADHHGFDCTVLFSVNEDGLVDPTLPAPFKDKTKQHSIPGLEQLATADCVILLSRFMQLPDEQLAHFHNYFDSGKPLLALRTANHGFWGSMKYQVGGEEVSLNQLLGGKFMGHHGGWHRESTRGQIVPESAEHPILSGVTDIWGTSDVYRCHNEDSPFPEDCEALVLGQPLVDLTPTAEPNTNKEALPIAWVKTWEGNQGLSSRIFHFTMGSAKDFENKGVRRLTVNAVYWGLEMEDQIDGESSVEILGKYAPMKSGFNYEKFGVRPRKPSFFVPR